MLLSKASYERAGFKPAPTVSSYPSTYPLPSHWSLTAGEIYSQDIWSRGQSMQTLSVEYPDDLLVTSGKSPQALEADL